jgi:hypothetical protein
MLFERMQIRCDGSITHTSVTSLIATQNAERSTRVVYTREVRTTLSHYVKRDHFCNKGGVWNADYGAILPMRPLCKQTRPAAHIVFHTEYDVALLA